MLLVLGSGFMSAQLTSISQGWQLVLNIGFGTGVVYILRWYWSRINAWSEIVAMAVAAATTVLLSQVSISGNGAVVLREDRDHHHGGDHGRVVDRDICNQPGIR